MSDYQFEKEFDINPSIGWWNTNRGFANHGIRCFNTWQLNGCPTSEKEMEKFINEQSEY